MSPPLFPTSTSKGLMSPQSQLDISSSQLEEESSNELENALIRLEEEQQRCRRGSPGCRVLRDPPGITPWPCAPPPRSSSLVQVNSMLREQLEQANVANAALSEDIRKLTADWTRARDELEQREAEWRREEEVGDVGLRGENLGPRGMRRRGGCTERDGAEGDARWRGAGVLQYMGLWDLRGKN